MSHIVLIYLVQTLTIPWCLWVCGWLLKHIVPQFPNRLIPVILITLSVVMSITIPDNVQHLTIVDKITYIEDSIFGVFIGFFSIGVHAVAKDILKTLQMKKWCKKYKEHTGRDITINLNDSDNK